ncbi:MAG: YdcF family protein [Thermodesulfovibrionales bacterium]|nr:YdcF family protein [Thermodesulfovibrionales bacterium]
MFKCLKILIAFLILAALLYIGHGFILKEAGKNLYYKDELKPADVIVVLAGEETERVEHGVKLFKEGWARKDRIILTGGPLIWKYTWASLMQEHAMHLGAPKSAILLADKSRTTEEDALFTREIMDKHGYKSCIIVTSPYHSRRALKIFKRFMGDKIKIISAPADESWFSFDEWWKRERDRARVLNEYSKFLWLLIFGFKNEAPA